MAKRKPSSKKPAPGVATNFGNSDMTVLGGDHFATPQRDSSGNLVTSPDSPQKKLSDEQRKRMTQTLMPGDPKIIHDELTTGQTGILYGLPKSPLVMMTDPGVTTLYKRYYTTYDKYRQIRKDPTVAICRAAIAGAILSSAWTVKGADNVDPVLLKFIGDQLLKKHYRIMETAVYGCIDFGWQGYEKIFQSIDYVTEVTDGEKTKNVKRKLIGLRKLKPLLQDMTSIMVQIHSGDFSGFRQGVVFVEAPAKALLISFRVEGTMWHGCPLLEDVKDSVEKWNEVETGASRYDRKIAGSHFVVHYPLGSSRVGGVETDNGTVAASILASLEASGSITVPRALSSFVEGMEQSGDNLAWEVELLSDRGARQSSFVDRARYLDSCKARAMHVPERAILEGQFGTKAESEGHQDVMTVLLENLAYHITEEINCQLVDQLVELNWGPDMIGKVWLESPPISDDKIQFIRSILGQALGNPNGFMEMFPYLDYSTMMDMTDLPKNREVVKKEVPEQPQPGLSPEQLQMVQGLGLKPGMPQPLNRLLKALGGPEKAAKPENGPNPAPTANPVLEATVEGLPETPKPGGEKPEEEKPDEGTPVLEKKKLVKEEV